jgi:amidohydrolase
VSHRTIAMVHKEMPMAANDPDSVIREQAARLQPRLVELRRDLHAHPELGFEEVRTAGIVAAELARLGIAHRTGLGRTGVLGFIDGGAPGPTLLIRADMDALPIHERTGQDFASTIDGRMHACGHDIHTVTLLGVAEVLKGLAPAIRGRVALVFQPAEEKLSGAAAMIADGVLDLAGASMCLGFHNAPNLAPEQFGWVNGAGQAGSDAFDIVLHGRSGHAAHPYAAIDPILAASQLVQALQGIVAREVNPMAAAVVTVGELHAGSVRNIIPDQARLSGTIRTFEDSIRDLVVNALRRITEGVAAATRARAEISVQRQVPPTVSDPAIMARVVRAVAAQFGPQSVREGRPSLGAEDFAEFTTRIPGAHLRIGSQAPGRHDALHNSDYQPDERSIGAGVQAISRAALELLA